MAKPENHKNNAEDSGTLAAADDVKELLVTLSHYIPAV
jgi:hypothetical protein